MTIRTILADDHPILRQGLSALLESNGGFDVIGEASDGIEAVDAVERLKPDLLVIDAAMPNLNGLEATRLIKHRLPQTKVLVLSMHKDEGYVLQALRNGADGYVLKDETATAFVLAAQEVAAGRHYLSPALSDHAITALIQRAKAVLNDELDCLSDREREVLQLMAEGNSNANIAERLHISPRTSETHRTNIMRKLHLKNQTELVLFAVRTNVLKL